MKFVGVREAQQQLSGLVEDSQKERVVLTRHGAPVAILAGIEGRDIEEILLGQDLEFRELIAQRRRSTKPLVSHETLKARAREDVKRAAGSRPRRRRAK